LLDWVEEQWDEVLKFLEESPCANKLGQWLSEGFSAHICLYTKLKLVFKVVLVKKNYIFNIKFLKKKYYWILFNLLKHILLVLIDKLMLCMSLKGS